jgi:uncharacterized protein (TIGR02246 family)
MKNFFARIFLLLFVTFFLVNAFAQLKSYSKNDLASLKAIPEKWIQSWNAHNIDSLSSLLHNDIDAVTVPGTWLKGKKSFVEDHGAKFLTIFKDSRLVLDTVAIKYLKPDLAVIHVGWGISGDLDREGNQQKLRHGISTWVVIKEKNKWMIMVSHTMLKLVPGSAK